MSQVKLGRFWHEQYAQERKAGRLARAARKKATAAAAVEFKVKARTVQRIVRAMTHAALVSEALVKSHDFESLRLILEVSTPADDEKTLAEMLPVALKRWAARCQRAEAEARNIKMPELAVYSRKKR